MSANKDAGIATADETELAKVLGAIHSRPARRIRN